MPKWPLCLCQKDAAPHVSLFHPENTVEDFTFGKDHDIGDVNQHLLGMDEEHKPWISRLREGKSGLAMAPCLKHWYPKMP